MTGGFFVCFALHLVQLDGFTERQHAQTLFEFEDLLVLTKPVHLNRMMYEFTQTLTQVLDRYGGASVFSDVKGALCNL